MKSAAPNDLSPNAKKLYGTIRAGWDVDEAANEVLLIALRARDRSAKARELIAKDGLVVKGTKGAHAHPAWAILRESEATELKAWRQLALAGAPNGVPGRPAGTV